MDPKRDGILKVRKITNISWALKIATAKKKDNHANQGKGWSKSYQ